MTASLASSAAVDPRLAAQRRALVAESAHVYGVDRIDLIADDPDRCTIDIFFVASVRSGKPSIPRHLTGAQIAIASSVADGGRHVASRLRRHPHDTTILTVDFPPSALFMNGSRDGRATVELRRDDVDPLLSRATVNITPRPRLGRDPVQEAAPHSPPRQVDVNYLAKDFESYRQLMLDHVVALQPAWEERHPADMTNAIVEILAYAADSLSYYQDAVATETYLSTARRRVSLKRHARLLDYQAHEGCAARVWVQICVAEAGLLKAGLRLLCDEPKTRDSASIHVASLLAPPIDGSPVFETMCDAQLHPELNRLDFYDWGTDDFRLPVGAVSAAIVGRFDMLNAGDTLILAQTLNPISGDEKTADRMLRHAVRLNQPPTFGVDPLTGQIVTAISWSTDDALPFDLLVVHSAGGKPLRGISAAFGNIVPADVGFTITETIDTPVDDARDFLPQLARNNLICAAPWRSNAGGPKSAAAFASVRPLDAVPAVSLVRRRLGMPDQLWRPVADLLRSERFAHEFVAETEDDGVTTLRFGDNCNGAAAPAAARFQATYRIGAPDSNIGADSLRSWAPRSGDEFIASVWNPLPATGGVARQSAKEIRFHAPNSFRTQRRCVIPQDYVDALAADPRVKAVVAEERWAGSWNTAILYVQPTGGHAPDIALLDDIARSLEPLRLIGGDYRLQPPRYVPIEIAISVAVKPPFAPVAVRRNIVAAIRARLRFGTATFGAPVYLSPIVAAAMAEPGVTGVKVRHFQRHGGPAAGEREKGRIEFDRFEIPILDDQTADGVHGLLSVIAETVGDE